MLSHMGLTVSDRQQEVYRASRQEIEFRPVTVEEK